MQNPRAVRLKRGFRAKLAEIFPTFYRLHNTLVSASATRAAIPTGPHLLITCASAPSTVQATRFSSQRGDPHPASSSAAVFDDDVLAGGHDPLSPVGM